MYQIVQDCEGFLHKLKNIVGAVLLQKLKTDLMGVLTNIGIDSQTFL